MANGKIPKTAVKIKAFTFRDLTQYSPQSYYFYIAGIKSKAGIPSEAMVVNASVGGWSGLGTAPNVQLAADDTILVLFTYGTTITNDAYITVRFAYI